MKKREHIRTLHMIKTDRVKDKIKIYPKRGGTLITRKGKNGSFQAADLKKIRTMLKLMQFRKFSYKMNTTHIV